MTLLAANERGPMPAAEPRRFPEVGPDEPSVHVRSVSPEPESSEAPAAEQEPPVASNSRLWDLERGGHCLRQPGL